MPTCQFTTHTHTHMHTHKQKHTQTHTLFKGGWEFSKLALYRGVIEINTLCA